MERIELALSVLRNEIHNLKKEYETEVQSAREKDQVMEKIQKLNRAIKDIQKHFNIVDKARY